MSSPLKQLIFILAQNLFSQITIKPIYLIFVLVKWYIFNHNVLGRCIELKPCLYTLLVKYLSKDS